MHDGLIADVVFRFTNLIVGAAIFGAMLLAARGGHAYRTWKQARPGSANESAESVAQEGYLIGSAFGLLALLLAFSFGMVVNRYEQRRDLAMSEANAIGTAYLRAQLLDEPYRSRLGALLVAYTQNRIEFVEEGGREGVHMSRNTRLLSEIWTEVRQARDSAAAHGLTTALLMTINEIIDLDAERQVAWQLRVPSAILILLVVSLVTTAAMVGHQIDGPRGRRSARLLFILLSLSLAVIIDMNRPMSGRERESQKPLLLQLQAFQAQGLAEIDRP